MLVLEKIERSYQLSSQHSVRALAGVSLTIPQGEFAAIVGASGSGKSTLLNILGLLDKPTQGRYQFGDTWIEQLDDDAMSSLRNAQIGFVFQSFHLMPRLSVLENVLLPLRYARVEVPDALEHAKSLLERIGLSSRISHKPSELSGGQQQRVAICRALLMRPPVLLADEPTGNLDSKSASEVTLMLKELHQAGQTIVLVTHDHDIAQMAQRVITLKDGLVAGDERIL